MESCCCSNVHESANDAGTLRGSVLVGVDWVVVHTALARGKLWVVAGASTEGPAQVLAIARSSQHVNVLPRIVVVRSKLVSPHLRQVWKKNIGSWLGEMV